MNKIQKIPGSHLTMKAKLSGRQVFSDLSLPIWKNRIISGDDQQKTKQKWFWKISNFYVLNKYSYRVAIELGASTAATMRTGNMSLINVNVIILMTQGNFPLIEYFLKEFLGYQILPAPNHWNRVKTVIIMT